MGREKKGKGKRKIQNIVGKKKGIKGSQMRKYKTEVGSREKGEVRGERI